MQKQWELADLVTYMRANKVTRVKLGGLEVDLSPQAFVAELESPPVASDPKAKMPSDFELLNWSTPLMDDDGATNGQA